MVVILTKLHAIKMHSPGDSIKKQSPKWWFDGSLPW